MHGLALVQRGSAILGSQGDFCGVYLLKHCAHLIPLSASGAGHHFLRHEALESRGLPGSGRWWTLIIALPCCSFMYTCTGNILHLRLCVTMQPFFFWLVAAWVKSRAERPSVSVVNRQLHVQIGCKLRIRNRKDELEASKAKQITN